jgi:hypothetical protein
VGIGPVPADQPPVPAQQRVWREQAAQPQRPGQQPGQRGQDRTVGPRQQRGFDLALELGDLVAQDEELGVLGPVRAGGQGESAEYLQHCELGES